MNIGLIGCGRWGKNILRDLISLECKVYVVERNNSNRKLAKKLGATAVLNSIDELSQMDGYIVATQTIYHYSVIKSLIGRNRPIFVEKPLTNQIEQTLELVRDFSDRIFVMHKWRYHPAIEKIKQIADSGEFGDIVSIELKRKQWGNPHTDVDASWILLPHDLSIVLHLLNNLPRVNWAAGIATHNNMLDTVFANLGTSPICNIEISSRYMVNNRELYVRLEKADVRMQDSLASHIELRKLENINIDEAPIAEISIDSEWPLLREIRAFIQYLKGESSVLNSSMADEIRIMETLEEIRFRSFEKLVRA